MKSNYTEITSRFHYEVLLKKSLFKIWCKEAFTNKKNSLCKTFHFLYHINHLDRDTLKSENFLDILQTPFFFFYLFKNAQSILFSFSVPNDRTKPLRMNKESGSAHDRKQPLFYSVRLLDQSHTCLEFCAFYPILL